MKSDWENYFWGKKITVMGLGLLGRGIQVVKFLHKMGAILLVTDLKTRKQLAPALKKLANLSGIKYVLGEHRLEDFEHTDMIMRAPNAPLDSPFLAGARNGGVPIEMDASLFRALAPVGVIIIGVTGTRGKTTTTMLIYELLKASGRKVFLGGNVREGVALPLLFKVRSGDFVVLELDSWQLQGFGDRKISPQIAVFTSFMEDHLNYYKGDMRRYFRDKANIFYYQKEHDHLVIDEEVLGRYPIETKAKIHKISPHQFKSSWITKLLGVHNQNNILCAFGVADILNISEKIKMEVLASFKPVSGRMELLGTQDGVCIINDNNATTPDATIAALKTFGKNKNVILIMGGADKGLDMTNLIKSLPHYCRAVILYKGSGTEKIVEEIKSSGVLTEEATQFKEAVRLAFKNAKKGDTFLFSPAFASFGHEFQNEYERNDQFIKLITRRG